MSLKQKVPAQPKTPKQAKHQEERHETKQLTNQTKQMLNAQAERSQQNITSQENASTQTDQVTERRERRQLRRQVRIEQTQKVSATKHSMTFTKAEATNLSQSLKKLRAKTLQIKTSSNAALVEAQGTFEQLDSVEKEKIMPSH